MAVKTGMTRLTLITDTPPSADDAPIVTTLLKNSGTWNALGLPPKMTMARFCIKNDTPMAVYR
jgi:hypothetical protein